LIANDFHDSGSRTMIVGMHFSVAGKYYSAVEKAHELGCNALQIFAQNPRGWRVKEFADGEVNTFRRLVSEYAIEAVVVHTPYLVNLASPNLKLVWQSRRAVATSLQRADVLGAQYVVTHIGSTRGRGLAGALQAVSEGLDEILAEDHEALLLLENTAGAGHIVGSTFEELATIIDASKASDRLCICLDTAHAFAAGYDLATSDGLGATLQELDRLIGIDRLKVVHINDTKVALGSHVDRHWHIGMGNIGLKGFSNIVNQPRLAQLPFILETPVDGVCDDTGNLRALRSLFHHRDTEEAGSVVDRVGAVVAPPLSDATERMKGGASTAPTTRNPTH